MGVAFSCDRCPTAATSSVVNLSDHMVLRAVEGVEPPKAADLGISADEKDWIEKIKCLDEAHSAAYNLNLEGIHELMDRVEKRIKENTLKKHCSTDVVKGCYKFNSTCSLNCAKEVDEFIGCLDAKRLQRLRAIMDEARKKKELANQAEKSKRRAQLR